MRTTVRVPLAGGVGAIVFEANSEDTVILISAGDGPSFAVRATELAHAMFLLASAVKIEADAGRTVRAIGPWPPMPPEPGFR